MNDIINDATPLITFVRIGQLSLLQKIVGTLVIPTAVADEISVYTQERPGVIDSGSVGILIRAKQIGEIVALETTTGGNEPAGHIF